MKWLRIELRRERFDTAFVHAIGPGGEALAYAQIFQIQMFQGLACLIHRESVSYYGGCMEVSDGCSS